MKVALEHLILSGLSRSEAAQKAGLTDHALYCALRKPSVLAYRNSLLEAMRTSAASRTIAKAEKLMDSAESEHVQADMTKWLAGLDGMSPVSKSESVNIHKGLMPGLTVNFVMPSAPGDSAVLIDNQGTQSQERKQINNLPERIPHPSERNAIETGHPPADSDPGRRGGGGAKT